MQKYATTAMTTMTAIMIRNENPARNILFVGTKSCDGATPTNVAPMIVKIRTTLINIRKLHKYVASDSNTITITLTMYSAKSIIKTKPKMNCTYQRLDTKV